MEEIKEHGPYPTSTQFNNLKWIKIQNKEPIPEREENLYVDAFWQWWPSLYPDLHTFRNTGGEPLLSKHTFQVLDYIISNPNTQLELSINSNFCVPDELFDKFIKKLQLIKKQNAVKSLIIYTSCEAHGQAAEYIRHGLDYNLWLLNCEKYLSTVPNSKLGIMSTYNALSVTSYNKFLNDIAALNVKYGKLTWYEKILKFVLRKQFDKRMVVLDIPYLNNPPHQSVGILTENFLESINDQIATMYDLGFYNSEIQKLERLLSVYQSKLDSNQINNRKDFIVFVDEHDKRRGTNFLKTFPEMTEFYNLCKGY
jgi:hypothetical protein